MKKQQRVKTTKFNKTKVHDIQRFKTTKFKTTKVQDNRGSRQSRFQTTNIQKPPNTTNLTEINQHQLGETLMTNTKSKIG